MAARARRDGIQERSCEAETFNLLGSFFIAIRVLSTVDTILGCLLTVGYTLCYWYFGQHLATNMNWNLVSLAVVFPISQGVVMGFKRREQALVEFGNLFGNMSTLWGAIHSWNLQKKDESTSSPKWIRVIDAFADPEETKHSQRALFEDFLTAIATYFDLARAGRARQAMSCYKAEAIELMDITWEQRLRVNLCLARMQRLVQELKSVGLAGGEAHRLDSYISKMTISLDRLCYLKEYRTPQAFRALARVYILCIGAPCCVCSSCVMILAT